MCKAPRCGSDGKSHKQVTYWPLLLWLRMMLADPDIGPGMVNAMKEAREAAGTSPGKYIRDWCSYIAPINTNVLISLSTSNSCGLQDSVTCREGFLCLNYWNPPAILGCEIALISPLTAANALSSHSAVCPCQ